MISHRILIVVGSRTYPNRKASVTKIPGIKRNHFAPSKHFIIPWFWNLLSTFSLSKQEQFSNLIVFIMQIFKVINHNQDSLREKKTHYLFFFFKFYFSVVLFMVCQEKVVFKIFKYMNKKSLTVM